MEHSSKSSDDVEFKDVKSSAFTRLLLGLHYNINRYTVRLSYDVAKHIRDITGGGGWHDTEFDAIYRRELKQLPTSDLEIMSWAHHNNIHRRRPRTIEAIEDELMSRIILVEEK